MKHDLPSTRRSAITTGVVIAFGAGMVTAGVITGAADSGGGDRPPTTQAVRLVSYDSCDHALAQMKEQALPHVGPYGFDFGANTYGAPGDTRGPGQPRQGGAEGDSKVAAEAAPQAQQQDHSTTNVHEAGVDEPDLVKTDGKRVVSITDGVVRVMDVASRKQTAAIALDGVSANQLLIDGDRALVMTGNNSIIYDAPSGVPKLGDVPGGRDPSYGSELVLVDLTGAGRILGRLAVDGTYLDARQVGDVARVVVHSAPRLQFRYPEDNANPMSSSTANKDVIEHSSIQDWLPRYQLSVGAATTSGQLTACADVSHPVDYTASSMLTVLTFDLRKDLGTGAPVTIVADGDTVYGTDKSLYVADDHVIDTGGFAPPTDGAARTELYQFDISKPGKPVHVASGTVDGVLLNQYSLSEYGGNLRVATTTGGQAGTANRITVLTRKGNQLTPIGLLDGLGVSERIYAVRYFGDTAYVVTFKQTDPLYTVDLRDPAAPKVTGELKITGYSAYLHPAGDGRLIGVGQEADSNGRVQGAQVSLFDTANPAGATRLAQYHLAGSWTEAENDPHAFLYWPDKKLLVLPISGGGAADPNNPDPAEPYGGALVLKLTDNSFTRLGLVNHRSDRYGDVPLTPRRAMVIGDELWTVSEGGAMVNDLDSLSQLSWIPFT